MGRPDVNGRAALFVPAIGRELEMPTNIKNGAGIVGFGNRNGTVTVYFESNRFGDPTLKTWESKVRLAYSRMVGQLPTTSHMVMNSDLLEQVGIMDSNGAELVHLDGLKRWLACSNAVESVPERTMLIWKK